MGGCSLKITAKEIAQKMGISQATVSLVINNKPGVCDTTRKKVIHMMKENGYYPSILPINNKSKKGNIRFVSYKRYSETLTGTAFFSELVEGIDREARNIGYNISVTYIDEQLDDVEEVIKMIKNEKPDGILVLGTELQIEDVIKFSEMHIPMLVLDNFFEEETGNYICIDNIAGVYGAVKYLFHMGHRKIGYIHSSVKINNFSLRMKGIKKAIREKGLELLPEHIFCIDSNAKDEKVYQQLVKTMQSKQAPTAIFADNDNLAHGAIQTLKSNGILSPRDVSVIGFDDMPFCEMMDPKLTTVHVFKERMGTLAMQRLAEMIEEKPQEYIKSFIGTELIIRESVRAIE